MKSFIFLTLVLAGCASTRDYEQLTTQVANNGVSVIHSQDDDAVCFVYKDSDGTALSCFKKGRKK
jgi:hypothetical protein